MRGAAGGAGGEPDEDEEELEALLGPDDRDVGSGRGAPARARAGATGGEDEDRRRRGSLGGAGAAGGAAGGTEDSQGAVEMASGVPRHLFSMEPRHVRSLLRHQQALLMAEDEIAAPASSVGEGSESGTEQEEESSGGKLVLDPCLGRWELIRAKSSLGCVLLSGVVVAAIAAYCGHSWIRIHLDTGAIPPLEASLIMGVILPAVGIAFLCALEHSEWVFLQRVAPQSQLRYTPALHKLARLWQGRRGR
mmetsp:Transcript_40369/g.129596  ORF Transcript_40369/g.129596 Transcript_40369/m.129596 type:complete len:249 (+) Transcript_40369:84-830(+)